MDKSQIQSAVSKFKSAGITAWGVFCRGGNYELRHNGKDTFNILSGDYLIHLKNAPSFQNSSMSGQFEIDLVPWEDINYIFPVEVSYIEASKLLQSLGVSDPDVDKFLKNPGIRYNINTNSRAMRDGDIVDDNGATIEKPQGRSAYVVEADADRRVEQVIAAETEEKKEIPKWHQVVKLEEESNP